MSVMPICAIIEPSINSTIECTIDCGCTTTAICDAGAPNSQCASITSSPLFISVAESIVIFGPICQVGCLSASAAVTSSRLSRARPRNGPPDAVRISRRSSLGERPCRHWWMALCSLSTGRIAHAAPPRRIHHQPAGHHQHFLVGERDGLAARRSPRAPPRAPRCRTRRRARCRRRDASPPRSARRCRAPCERRAVDRTERCRRSLVDRRAGRHGDRARLVACAPAPRTPARCRRPPARRPRQRSACVSTTDERAVPIDPSIRGSRCASSSRGAMRR